MYLIINNVVSFDLVVKKMIIIKHSIIWISLISAIIIETVGDFTDFTFIGLVLFASLGVVFLIFERKKKKITRNLELFNIIGTKLNDD